MPPSRGLDVDYGHVNCDNQNTASPENLTKQDVTIYQLTMANYQPNEFSQQDGWINKSHSGTYNFCTKEKKLGIFPHTAICPLYPDTQPTGGYRDTDGKGVSWIPILDNNNTWIQVACKNTCTR